MYKSITRLCPHANRFLEDEEIHIGQSSHYGPKKGPNVTLDQIFSI